MNIGSVPNDLHAILEYVRARILPLAPGREPIPFRGKIDLAADSLPFFDELDASLKSTPGAVWNILGPPGSGKTYFAMWAAARWGRRFLDDPVRSPAPLWIPADRLRTALADDRSLTGGPFAFALAFAPDVPGQSPESIARLLVKRPCIAIVDKDETGDLDWKLELPLGLPPDLRILHLALKDSLGGPCVRLSHWDLETSLMAAHERRGSDGVQLVDALASSPAGALARLPWFVVWLLDRKDATPEFAGSPACVETFLRDVWAVHRADAKTFEEWCHRLFLAHRSEGPPSRLARHLLLTGSTGVDAMLSETLEANLLPHAIQGGPSLEVLSSHRFGETELNAMRSHAFDGSALVKLVHGARKDPLALSNAINICWLVGRQEVPIRALRHELTGILLPGHAFRDGLVDAKLTKSNLDGISTAKPFCNCAFFSTTFREASLSGAVFLNCGFHGCAFELADLSGARFKGCTFNSANLADGIWSGAEFERCLFKRGVVLASTEDGEGQRFIKCAFDECDLSKLSATGLYADECRFLNTSFAGLSFPAFDAREAVFEKCDMIGLSAPGANLLDARLVECLLADACLQRADLRRAKLIRVEFQPGPASRAGMTDELTRTDPMHGSKDGFYAQDLSDGVYLDPDLVRTADLREADLRAASLDHTDLFRVDLRDARMDPAFEEAALRMRAIIE